MTDHEPAPRRELPTDPSRLEPMGSGFDAALERGLEELELRSERAGSPQARASYEAHARLLRDWNVAINLTAVRDPADVARRHVIDTLSAVPRLAPLLPAGASLLDIGSGGGYPGLPLAAALPLSRVELLDSVTKKARFLAVAASAVAGALRRDDLEAPSIEAVAERAEDQADEPDERAAWDVVTARAVGSLAEVMELALPLTREGGLAVAWKREGERDAWLAELGDARSIIHAAGGSQPDVVDAGVSTLPGHRLIIVRKLRPSPLLYPRPVSVRRGGRR